MNHVDPARARIIRSAILVLLVLAVGCETPIGPIRATTFPPDLSYLPPARIRTTMWVLAAEIQDLEESLRNRSEYEESSLQNRVRLNLERMYVAARTLDQGGRTTQHPVLNEHLVRFLTRLERARRDVDHSPPNYYRASTIAGSCYLCHGRNQSAGFEGGAPMPLDR